MKLSSCLLRLNNYIKFQNVPGNILIGKHRIWPKLNVKTKRYMLRQIDNELNTMTLISVPFISKDDSKAINESIETENKINAKKAKRMAQHLNKNKIEDRLMTQHFDILRNWKAWN